ncbi:RCC1 domain-containing protein [Gorillibacterium sp. sgz5001074]|uniref:RCC1 domain-containing protein n=1 Tax=Gorillibacterium sp. sgz5001074 TaxID=3446695 RepID=UPI003F676348
MNAILKIVKTATAVALITVTVHLAPVMNANAASTQDKTAENERIQPPYIISASGIHSIAKDTEGNVWYWNNVYTNFFNQKVAQDKRPKFNFSKDIASIQAGQEDLIIKKDGTVWETGYLWDNILNEYTFCAPKQIDGLQNIVKTTSEGGSYAAIDADGSVWVWSSSPERTKPIKLEDIKAIDISINDDLYILKDDKTVWKWTPYLGGSIFSLPKFNTSRNVSRIEGLSNIASLSHTVRSKGYFLVIKNDGTIWGWATGYNSSNPFGLTDVMKPTLISSLTDVKSIITIFDTVIFLKNDGTVWKVGRELGLFLGEAPYFNMPVKVEPLKDIASIAAGEKHALALTTDGVIWMWGHYGNHGYNDPEPPHPLMLPEK